MEPSHENVQGIFGPTVQWGLPTVKHPISAADTRDLARRPERQCLSVGYSFHGSAYRFLRAPIYWQALVRPLSAELFMDLNTGS